MAEMCWAAFASKGYSTQRVELQSDAVCKGQCSLTTRSAPCAWLTRARGSSRSRRKVQLPATRGSKSKRQLTRRVRVCETSCAVSARPAEAIAPHLPGWTPPQAAQSPLLGRLAHRRPVERGGVPRWLRTSDAISRSLAFERPDQTLHRPRPWRADACRRAAP